MGIKARELRGETGIPISDEKVTRGWAWTSAMGLVKRCGSHDLLNPKMERRARKLDMLEFLEVADAVGIDSASVIRHLRAAGNKRQHR